MKGLEALTKGRITPLSRELGISRKRLSRWIEGSITDKDLTVGEYTALKNHNELNAGLKTKPELQGQIEFLSIYKVRFLPEKVKEGLDLFYQYINEPNLAIDCLTGQPYGDSSCHLIATLKTDSLAYDDLVGINKYSNHWPVRIDTEAQKTWLEIAVRLAGSQSNFDEIWKRFNLAIEWVKTDIICMTPPDANGNHGQLNLL